jgi:hypothetical protein
MKMPNFASVHHDGVGRRSSDAHSGLYDAAVQTDAAARVRARSDRVTFLILISFF